jgi:hypothetical protein
MVIIGCDLSSERATKAFVDTDTRELRERRLGQRKKQSSFTGNSNSRISPCVLGWNRVDIRSAHPFLEEEPSQASEVIQNPTAASQMEFELLHVVGRNSECVQAAGGVRTRRTFHINLKLSFGFCHAFPQEH